MGTGSFFQERYGNQPQLRCLPGFDRHSAIRRQPVGKFCCFP
ncbi:MAG: hypothetical protein AVDCRST_MAG56-2374 [uncultured Cytophagales bacterium]|uniref:Uncharacterized protein n=1 Tax=uncultured Cytophagales bacterium TaxID=158755 RepID=A0A6J4GZQ7_9SPHI|nr:MAG: hypothetical protein AVDCRST_MAG56-2374 [uncultured Cytophagales bacterium]